MRKIYFLMLAMLCSMALSVNAQTLLDEDFEHTRSDVATTQFPDGWTTITSYTGSHTGYRWTIGKSSNANSTMGGYYYAYCDAPTYDKGDNDGVGPRKDIIVTPEMTLNGTYQLAFDWEAAAYACLSQKAMTLQVAVIDMAAPKDTTVIFDIQNEDDVRNSGVPTDPYGSYIWQNWAIQHSKIDLDAYEGKTIKIAFIYNLQKKVANIVYLDNISVKYHQPLNGPIAELVQTRYELPEMYIGEKRYTETIQIKNVGKKGLKVTGFDAPDCITVPTDLSQIDLGINETAGIQVAYTASLTSPAECDVVFHTNGGDVTLHVVAHKQAVPDGYTLELFEGEQFAPAGWTADGFATSVYALEGDKSAYSSASFTHSYLTTPRLDLSSADGPKKFMFTYYSMFSGENVPYNDLSVEISTNGGEKYDSIWVADYTMVDSIINVEIDLSKYESDNVRLRFKNSAISYSGEEVDEWTTFLIDRVLLPNLYGQEGVPTVAELVAPKQGEENVYTKNIQFKWLEAQFAEGYKIYIGKKDGEFDVVNGADLGNATTYKLAQADYATTYFWKVVPYNSVGEAADCPVWSFSTQADYTVKTFPWSENFEDKTFAPLGWSVENASYTTWSRTDYHPYEGEGTAMAYSNKVEETAYLTTPDIQVPATGKYQLSFWWGNERPVSLVNDPSTLHLNNTTAEDGIDAAFMDVQVDGEWKQVKLISGNTEADGKTYWCYETLDLTPYAGKTIAVRWRYIAHNYTKSRGAAIDNVKIEASSANVSFSTDGWDAYKVNYNTEEVSPKFAVTNLGSESVTISEVKFGTSYFSTTLAAGEELAPASSKQFTISVKAALNADATELNDLMTVTFSDGTSATLPVAAIAMGSDMLYYGFEHDRTGEVPAGFTGINADGSASVKISFWSFPNNGGMLSFFVLNDSECYQSLKEPHGSQSLMTRCNSNGAFDDWLVSSQLTATENSKLAFDARSWESVNSILPAGCPKINVLVSETSATDRSTFTQVGATKELSLFNPEEGWTPLSFDLSAYAGKKVFVAIQAYSDNCLGGFYDNVEFQHFINGVKGDINGDGVLNVSDVTALVNYLLGEADYPEAVCDINGDGRVNISDVTALINIIIAM
ncbi:MAG: choice-of-anchor J domain-containing protein [Bacteroidales bacterium]|nr:choice-of-anchor J domain-containing protein [Bacteroidales bacterium]